MPKSIPAPTPVLNRLRAAAGLLPLIESGLSDGKLSGERAALMLAFCEWAVQAESDQPEELRLATQVRESLERLSARLPTLQATP